MFAFGRFVVKFRWLIIIAWLAILAFGTQFAPKLAKELSTGGFEVPEVESTEARNLLETEFENTGEASLTILYHSKTLKVTDPDFQRAVASSAAKIVSDKKVAKVLTFYNTGNPKFISKDKDTTYAVVILKGKLDEATKFAPRIVKKAKDIDVSLVKIFATGAPVIWSDFSKISQKDLAQAEKLGLPIAAIVLTLAFSSVVAAGMPIILALIGLIVGFSVLYFIAQEIQLNIYVQNAAAMIGLGLGIDYSLFIVTRFREELQNNSSSREAIIKTLGTAGKAVLFSGLSVIVAISGLWLVKMEVFHSLAIGIAVVAGVTVLAALTLLPAILSLLGKRIDSLKLRVPGFSRSEPGKWWHGWAMAIMKRPIIFFILALLVLLAFALPALNIRLGQSGIEVVPNEAPSRQGFELLKNEFGPGELATIPIVIRKKDILEPASLKDLAALSEKLGKEEEVKAGGVDSLFTVLKTGVKFMSVPEGMDPFQLYSSLAKDPLYQPNIASFVNVDRSGDVSVIRVTPKKQAQHQDTQRLVKKIRDKIIPSVDGLSSRNVFVGGATAENIDFNSEIAKSFPLVLGFVFLLTYVILLILFRSLILPLKAIVTDALSVAGAYGLLVLIFQYGVGESILGFEAAGFVGSFTPIFLFSIIFGLSMDYEVFLLSRVKENYDKTKDNKESVALGLERTGRIITSAALIMITIFAAFGLTKLVPIKEVGIGMAIAIFLDATLVRVVLVPATMQLLGRWNWWLPRSLAKILPEVHHG